MIAAVKAVHEEHPSHGYRWTAAFIRINLKIKISDNYAYKCFRYLGIQAETKHRERSRPRKERNKYPNLIFSTWETVDRPRQVLVSDMTAFKYWIYYFEVTFYFDVFTKEILSWRVAERKGSREQYIDGLADVVELLKDCKEPTIIHTDQGSVYSSIAYNELIKDTNIVRSMSRAGKPTDNPVNEALNGWIKEELFVDFKIEQYSPAMSLGLRLRDMLNITMSSVPAMPSTMTHLSTTASDITRVNSLKKTPLLTASLPGNQSLCRSAVERHILRPCPLLKMKTAEKCSWCLLLKNQIT